VTGVYMKGMWCIVLSVCVLDTRPTFYAMFITYLLYTGVAWVVRGVGMYGLRKVGTEACMWSLWGGGVGMASVGPQGDVIAPHHMRHNTAPATALSPLSPLVSCTVPPCSLVVVHTPPCMPF
jgi:hypothetical protein